MEFIQKLDSSLKKLEEKVKQIGIELKQIATELETELKPRYYSSEIEASFPLRLEGRVMITTSGGYIENGYVAIEQFRECFSIVFFEKGKRGLYSEEKDHVFSPKRIIITCETKKFPEIEINGIAFENFCHAYVFHDATIKERFLVLNEKLKILTDKIINLEELKRKESCIKLIEEGGELTNEYRS